MEPATVYVQGFGRMAAPVNSVAPRMKPLNPKEKKSSDMVFDIRHDQVVEAYGFILQTSGIRTGGGVDLSWSQMGTSSPYNFVRVIKLVPVGKTM